MLRVGLGGDLGAGKTTVARMFAERGAVVLSSDEMGRALQQPGQPVFAEIVRACGNTVLAPDGTLDRKALSRLAFEGGRVEALNAIVHPAVLAEQARVLEQIGETQPDAIVLIESALLFSTRHGARPWSERFDRIVLVVASSTHKLSRFVDRMAAGRDLKNAERTALEADAKRRLALQAGNDGHAQEALVIRNDGDLNSLEEQVEQVWSQLKQVCV
jgi:dephospho-CoA kinase